MFVRSCLGPMERICNKQFKLVELNTEQVPLFDRAAPAQRYPQILRCRGKRLANRGMLGVVVNLADRVLLLRLKHAQT